MLNCTLSDGTLTVRFNGLTLVEHDAEKPFVTLYHGAESIDMYRGNFFIEDALSDARPLAECASEKSGGEWRVTFSGGGVSLAINFSERNGRLIIAPEKMPAGWNRARFSFFAQSGEHVYGCGEQFSSFDLRGRNYPIWTQEQGAGRNKDETLTQLMDENYRAGGDYYTTYYPQPTFVSSRGYYLHAETYSYADFDFSREERHELTFWRMPETMTIGAKESMLETVQDVSALLGRQKELPEWIYDGVILGVQGGSETCLEKYKKMKAAGCPVCGVWAQDWEGQKITSFGKRLKWNWTYDKTRYGNLPELIKELNAENVNFLAYINPYLLENESLYNEAKEKKLLALDKTGAPYLVDFGEFFCGIVDFTNRAARDWYADVICKNMIGVGVTGWMADFGEYLPVDVILHDGSDPIQAHNAWPGWWAEINERAVAQASSSDRCFFFMRAGNARSVKSCAMMWAGDQNVNWSEDDGLPSALTSALSLAMCGMGLHHSDIGGYTTVRPYLKRSKELLLRWAEFSAFTVLMRTHEGNIPEDNWQFDGDDETMRHFARMSSIHAALKPYLMDAVRVNHADGIPVMRPVFLHYDEERFYTCKDEYLLGRDLFVAPVMQSRLNGRETLLPDDSWVNLFTGKKYGAGSHYVDAPIGSPPVFYREASPFAELFTSIFAKWHV